MTKTKIFISRKLGTNSPFKKGLDLGSVDITDLSLIQFSPLPFEDQNSDWLFFYSKSGVKYFLDQGGSFYNKKIGTFGPATADFFQRKTNKEVEFIGSGFKQDVAEKFHNITSDEQCLFVVGNNSLRSIQKLIGSEKNSEIVVYDNIPLEEFEIPNPDIAVFTSPMAVETYFTKYKNRDHINIAIGNTTLATLKKIGKSNSSVSEIPTEAGLVKAVHSYLNNL